MANISVIEQWAQRIEVFKSKHTLPPNDAVQDAQKAVQGAQAAVDLASKSFDAWVVKFEEAERRALETEKTSSSAALAGAPVASLGAELAAAQTAARIAKDALDLAAQAREGAQIVLAEAKAELYRRQMEQAQERANADTALLNSMIDELSNRPGGLHVQVKLTPFAPDMELWGSLQAIETEVRERKSKFEKVRNENA